MDRAVLTAAFQTIPGAPLRGSFFRAIPLEHIATPLSAIGSILRGGRFNSVGEFEAYYIAGEPDTTLYELRVIVPGAAPLRMKPTIMFTIDVDLQHTVDLTVMKCQRALGITTNDLLVEWKDALAAGRIPVTHDIGHAARTAHVEALIVPSARKAGATNLVVLVDRLRVSSTVTVNPDVGFPAGTPVSILGTHVPA